jgi:hypothetical protein
MKQQHVFKHFTLFTYNIHVGYITETFYVTNLLRISHYILNITPFTALKFYKNMSLDTALYPINFPNKKLKEYLTFTYKKIFTFSF